MHAVTDGEMRKHRREIAGCHERMHILGARLALPVAGRWVHNPDDPRLAACDDLLVELRAP